MAAEVSQVPIDGQLDLTFDGGGDTKTNPEFPSAMSDDIIPGTEGDNSFSVEPTEELPASLNEIDWEEPAAAGSVVSLAVADADRTADIDALTPSFDVNMGEPDLHVDLGIAAAPGDGSAQESVNAGEAEYVESGHASHAPDNGIIEDDVEHEITYDEEEPGEHLEAHTEVGDISPSYVVDQEQGDAEADVEGQSGGETPGDVGEGVEEEHDIEGDEAGSDHAEAQDEQSTDESEDDRGELPTSCPDISVSYRNQEYPLIHGQGRDDVQMGFFGDVGVLDLTVDNLLARLRQELIDDLGPQDELVLQVDELGLEYAEVRQIPSLLSY